jgi:AraC family transcriptional regulator of arabinose operon
MTDPSETAHTTVLNLLTGFFHETSGYRAVRRNGVKDWLLIHTVGGRGRFGHAGGELISEIGDWVLLRPGTPHDYGVEPSLQRWDLLWAHFQPRPDWLAWMNWPKVADGLMRLHIEGEALSTQFAEVHALLNSQKTRREAFAMNALEALLLHIDARNGHGDVLAGDARVARAMHYLDQHLADKVLIDDVANAVSLSPLAPGAFIQGRVGADCAGLSRGKAHAGRRRSAPAHQLPRQAGGSSRRVRKPVLLLPAFQPLDGHVSPRLPSATGPELVHQITPLMMPQALILDPDEHAQQLVSRPRHTRPDERNIGVGWKHGALDTPGRHLCRG